MRRSDNVMLIRQGWQQLERLWPVVVLDEAQNLSATALEEVRLLSCNRRDTQPPFGLPVGRRRTNSCPACKWASMRRLWPA